MSSLVSTHGMALATAMAVSGTVILLALCRPRQLADPSTQNPKSKKLGLRSCITTGSSGESRKMRKKKKRVRFAENVVVEFEAEGSSGDEFDCDYSYGYDYNNYNYNYSYDCGEEKYGVTREQEEKGEIVDRMPANRVALYNGILQARMHRIACSY